MEPSFSVVRSNLGRALRREAEKFRGRGQRAEAKTLAAEADTVESAGPGGPGATPGRCPRGAPAEPLGRLPGHVICPLVLTVFSWYSLSNFQDPSHATQA